MGQFEQDGLELGRRVACSLHYQHPRNLRLVEAAQATTPRSPWRRAAGWQRWIHPKLVSKNGTWTQLPR
jgi:hypothetical protein